MDLDAKAPTVFDDGLWKSERWRQDIQDPLTAEQILDRTATGERLRTICKSKGWPYRIVYEWIKNDPDMQQRFVTALEACGLDWAQEGMEILDESATAEQPHHVTAANNRAKYRAQLAGKLDRQRFGEIPAFQINAQSGSIISILAALPPVKAPEEIDVTPEEVRIEALKKTTVIPMELKDADELFKENKAKQDREDGRT